MDYDAALAHLGEWGPWNLFNHAVLWLPNFVGGVFVLTFSFTGAGNCCVEFKVQIQTVHIVFLKKAFLNLSSIIIARKFMIVPEHIISQFPPNNEIEEFILPPHEVSSPTLSAA